MKKLLLPLIILAISCNHVNSELSEVIKAGGVNIVKSDEDIHCDFNNNISNIHLFYQHPIPFMSSVRLLIWNDSIAGLVKKELLEKHINFECKINDMLVKLGSPPQHEILYNQFYIPECIKSLHSKN